MNSQPTCYVFATLICNNVSITVTGPEPPSYSLRSFFLLPDARGGLLRGRGVPVRNPSCKGPATSGIHRAAEKEGVLGNPRHEKSRGVKAPALSLVGLALRLSLEWAQPY